MSWKDVLRFKDRLKIPSPDRSGKTERERAYDYDGWFRDTERHRDLQTMALNLSERIYQDAERLEPKSEIESELFESALVTAKKRIEDMEKYLHKEGNNFFIAFEEFIEVIKANFDLIPEGV